MLSVGVVAQTNLHLIHDGICAQDVVLLLRVCLCMLYSPSGLPTGRQTYHHQDLIQVEKENSLILRQRFTSQVQFLLKLM